MAAPKVVSAKCPTCGANLPIPPGIPQVTCRYCQNVIHIEHRKPPPNVQPFGAPGAVPSRTLYIDPNAAAQASKNVGCAIAIAVLFPILLPLVFGVGPWAVRSCKGAVKPFPVACGLNEELELSGNFEATGPIVTSVGHNCKLHIKNSKLKGSTFIKTDAANMELTLDNVTIETTDRMIRTGANLKVHVQGSTLTSANAVFDSDSNMVIDAENSTFESNNAAAIKAEHNLKLHLDGTKIRGKKAGVDSNANMELTMKHLSEITSSDGVGVKTTSSLKLEAEGGKIDGPSGALVVTSNANITATGLSLSSKERAIAASSSLKLDYTDGSIISLGDMAIDADSSMELLLVNTKVQAATTAINCEGNSKIKASKKTTIAGTTGNGITTTSNSELVVADAAIEAGEKAFKGGVNNKVKLSQGARLAGKKGGIESEGNFDLDATGATVEGGSGHALLAGYNARLTFKQGLLRGTPALQVERKPTSVDLSGTRVEGEQKIPAR
ncbi:MAG TPA: hypothetical protein VM580_34750 [Labilithrix sp.]|nr:hypothetical protein [Labilithrix sp.]